MNGQSCVVQDRLVPGDTVGHTDNPRSGRTFTPVTNRHEVPEEDTVFHMIGIHFRQNTLCAVWRNQNDFKISAVWSNDRRIELHVLDSQIFKRSAITTLGHIKGREE